MKITGNTILITGGGSGIGADLARRFADIGNMVIIAGRNMEKLRTVAGGRTDIVPVQMDVADGASINRAVERLLTDHPALNMLINSAGVIHQEDLTADPVDSAVSERTIETNLLGPIRLIAALLPQFQRQPCAAVMNVTSGLAFVPLSYAPTYSATKAALHSYTVSLREQLRKTHVRILEIVPPSVQTDMNSGQDSPFGSMTLSAFTSEVMALLETNPSPAEILVDAVKPFRFAERDGQSENILRAFRGE